MKPGAVAATLRWRIRRRFHPLTRIGWSAAKSAPNSTQRTIGFVLMLLGWQLRRTSRPTTIYKYTAQPGEKVRIKVFEGDRQLSDTTVEM